MNRRTLASIIVWLLVSTGCGDSEVNLAYWDAGDAPPARLGDAGTLGDARSTDEESNPSARVEAAGAGSTVRVVVVLEGNDLEAALQGGLSLDEAVHFDTVDLSWRGDADLTLETGGEVRDVKPDFAQRGSFDARVELEAPTQRAIVRAQTPKLEYLRIAVSSRDASHPTTGE